MKVRRMAGEPWDSPRVFEEIEMEEVENNPFPTPIVRVEGLDGAFYVYPGQEGESPLLGAQISGEAIKAEFARIARIEALRARTDEEVARDREWDAYARAAAPKSSRKSREREGDFGGNADA